jgi:peptidoglycan/LPS O-acetylase OafA/YrhL
MRHIRELDGLRGIMALWVVFGHMLSALPPLFGLVPNSLYNSCPVQVFIMLSGFVIFSLLDRGVESYSRYIISRAFRIFPVYWVMLLISIFSLNFSGDILRASPHGFATDSRLQLVEAAKNNLIPHILFHIPLLQGVVPNRFLPYSALTFIGQAWSLTVEWQFYLAAPLLFLLATSMRNNWARIVVIIVAAVCWAINPYMNGGFLGNNWFMFFVGFLSYFAFQHVLSKLSRQQMVILAASLVALALIFTPQFAASLAIWIISLFCIVDARNEGKNNLVGNLLSTKVVMYLGKISYPIYMVHMQVLLVCMRLANLLELSMNVRVVAIPAVGVAATIVAAEILHRIVEAPFHKVGRRLSKQPSHKRRLNGEFEEAV